MYWDLLFLSAFGEDAHANSSSPGKFREGCCCRRNVAPQGQGAVATLLGYAELKHVHAHARKQWYILLIKIWNTSAFVPLYFRFVPVEE